MKKSAHVGTVRLIAGVPWQDAVIRLLEPQSPLRPWRSTTPVKAGEAVVVVLDTDPQSVIAAVGVVERDGDVDGAITAVDPFYVNGLIELGSLNMLADFVVSPEESAVYHSQSLDKVVQTIGHCNPSTAHALFAHTSLAAARVLLRSRGRCTGCDRPLALTNKGARDNFHIHTTSPQQARSGVDWPAALCASCHRNMGFFGFTRFLDYKYLLHPSCPSCSAQRTREAVYGMLAQPVDEPWIDPVGCDVAPENWICVECGHRWEDR